MLWKKADFVTVLFFSFLVYYLLDYLLDASRLWLASIATLLVLFENVLDVIWSSAEYRKMLQNRAEIKRVLKAARVKYLFTNAQGFVYLIRCCDDRICKIGFTTELNKRVYRLVNENGPIEIEALWKVPDVRENEKVALRMTQEFYYAKNGSREYRKMGTGDIQDFISDFTEGLSNRYSLLENHN
jgi:hypothetical protein